MKVRNISLYGLCLLAFFFGNLGVMRLNLCQFTCCHIEDVKESSCCSVEPEESCCAVKEPGSCCSSDTSKPSQVTFAKSGSDYSSTCQCSLIIDLQTELPEVVVTSIDYSERFQDPLYTEIIDSKISVHDLINHTTITYPKNIPPPITLDVCVTTTCLLI
jgi:hypothetical protein